MMAISDLPHVLAALNVTTTVFLTMGFLFIRQGQRGRHRACMIGALIVSAAFLAVYLYYHFNAGLARFGGIGWIRPVYFAILIAHVLMSLVITALVPVTVFLAATGRFDRHRVWARWTLPIWLYVAVSGVVVYVMAVHLFPFANG